MEFLAPLKQAIVSQTMGDFELLILDNACPPEARGELAAWARSDTRIRHLPIDERIPMFPNFNRGFRAARGKYFVSLNDDDLYAPVFLGQLVELLEAEPTVGFAGSWFEFINPAGAVTEIRRWHRAPRVTKGHAFIETLMRNGRNPLAMSGIMLRHHAMDPRGFDEGLSPYYGDFVLLMRIAERHDIGYVRAPLVQIRRHEDQASLRCDHAEGYVLRAAQLRGYVEELRQRWPNDPEFVDVVAHAFERSNRVFGVWGWLTAPDEVAASTCLDTLGRSKVDRAIQEALRRVGSIGFDVRARRNVAPFVRRIGNALRG